VRPSLGISSRRGSPWVALHSAFRLPQVRADLRLALPVSDAPSPVMVPTDRTDRWQRVVTCCGFVNSSLRTAIRPNNGSDGSWRDCALVLGHRSSRCFRTCRPNSYIASRWQRIRATTREDGMKGLRETRRKGRWARLGHALHRASLGRQGRSCTTQACAGWRSASKFSFHRFYSEVAWWRPPNLGSPDRKCFQSQVVFRTWLAAPTGPGSAKCKRSRS
jgi:hypothetical protein